jgi:hypothetical protein
MDSKSKKSFQARVSVSERELTGIVANHIFRKIIYKKNLQLTLTLTINPNPNYNGKNFALLVRLASIVSFVHCTRSKNIHIFFEHLNDKSYFKT